MLPSKGGCLEWPEGEQGWEAAYYIHAGLVRTIGFRYCLFVPHEQAGSPSWFHPSASQQHRMLDISTCRGITRAPQNQLSLRLASVSMVISDDTVGVVKLPLDSVWSSCRLWSQSCRKRGQSSWVFILAQSLGFPTTLDIGYFHLH